MPSERVPAAAAAALGVTTCACAPACASVRASVHPSGAGGRTRWVGENEAK